MIPIRVALIRPSRVGVNIGDHGKISLRAYLPKAPKVPSVETNDAGVEAVGIEIVVKNKIDDPGYVILDTAKKECSAFSRVPTTTLSQSSH